MGPPVAGKTTLSPLIASLCRIPSMTTRDVLMSVRDDDSDVSCKIETALMMGRLVDDDVMIDAIRVRTQRPDCAAG